MPAWELKPVNRSPIGWERRLGGWGGRGICNNTCCLAGLQDTEEEFTKFLKNVEELSPKLQEAAKVKSFPLTEESKIYIFPPSPSPFHV